MYVTKTVDSVIHARSGWRLKNPMRSDAKLVVLAFQFAIVTNEEISWNKRKSCSRQHGESEKMRLGLANMFMNKLKTN